MKRRKETADTSHRDDQTPEKDMDATDNWWSYASALPGAASLSAMQDAYSDFTRITAPFFTKENSLELATVLISNTLLPIASALITRHLVEQTSEEEDEEASINVGLILSALIPAASIVVRNTVNSALMKSMTSSMRHHFIHELEKDNVLALKNHSPHKTTDLPSASDIIVNNTGMFSRAAVPLVVGMMGNAIDFASAMHSSCHLVGAKTALSVGAIGVAAAILNGKINSLSNQTLRNNGRYEEGLGTTLRYAENNAQQVATLGSTKEFEDAHQLVQTQNAMRFKRSAVSGTAMMSNLIVQVVTPQILRSMTSLYPVGTPQGIIEAFSVEAMRSIRNIGNMVMPLTEGITKYNLTIERLKALHDILDDVNEFQQNNPLQFNYSDDDSAVTFSHFSLSKPTQRSCHSLLEKVQTSLADDELTILKETDLSLENGKTYQLLGQSGLGKSTLLKACTGSWPYASGTITFPCQKEEVYFIPQETITGCKSTLLEVMVYPKRESEISPSQKKDVIQFMGKLGLSERIPDLDSDEKKDWSVLSRGEQQRIAVIRMLTHQPQPKVLLMDEATASVDSTKSRIMHDLIKEHLPETTIIYISHDVQKHEEIEDNTPSGRLSPRFADATIRIDKDLGILKVSDMTRSKLLEGRDETSVLK